MAPEEANELLDKVKGSDPSALAELMDWKEVAEALETIAGLHYEYAVEEDAGYWRERGGEFRNVTEARKFLDMKQEDAPMRIVHRLTGESEEVERVGRSPSR